MPLWRKKRPESATVTLASGSDTESSGYEEQANSSLTSGYSRSVTSSHHTHQALPSRLQQSLASLPPMGVGAGPGADLMLSTRNGVSSLCVRPPLAFARTQSNPVFASFSWEHNPVRRVPSPDGIASEEALAGKHYRRTMRILVIGAPQVGKSSLVNSYRAAVTNNTMWPAAPVGICGFCGTTTVDPYPNHPVEPTWLCIDTPGRFYDARDHERLKRLFAGVPWKTRLAGKDALRSEDFEALPHVPENGAHQCIVVVSATDLIQDNGWISALFLRSRYEPAPDAENVIMSLQGLVSSIRSFLHDASPFIVISKMDLVGGAGNATARRVISSLLGRCIPVNRLYFSASPNDESSYESRNRFSLDSDTRRSFIRLHEDLALAFRWRNLIVEDA